MREDGRKEGGGGEGTAGLRGERRVEAVGCWVVTESCVLEKILVCMSTSR